MSVNLGVFLIGAIQGSVVSILYAVIPLFPSVKKRESWKMSLGRTIFVTLCMVGFWFFFMRSTMGSHIVFAALGFLPGHFLFNRLLQPKVKKLSSLAN